MCVGVTGQNNLLQVRRIQADQWLILKTLRLRALADAPTAFVTTLAEAEARTDAEWQAAAQDRAVSETDTTFLAFSGDEPCGMAGCYLSEESRTAAYLVAVWVDPRFRGLGVADALVVAIRKWAQSRGVTEIRAWVTETNRRATAFYTKVGFAVTASSEAEDGDVLMVWRAS